MRALRAALAPDRIHGGHRAGRPDARVAGPVRRDRDLAGLDAGELAGVDGSGERRCWASFWRVAARPRHWRSGRRGSAADDPGRARGQEAPSKRRPARSSGWALCCSPRWRCSVPSARLAAGCSLPGAACAPATPASRTAEATGAVYLMEAAGCGRGRHPGQRPADTLPGPVPDLVSAVTAEPSRRGHSAHRLGVRLADRFSSWPPSGLPDPVCRAAAGKASLARLWRPFDVVATANSLYGNLVWWAVKAAVTLYENGLAVATVARSGGRRGSRPLRAASAPRAPRACCSSAAASMGASPRRSNTPACAAWTTWNWTRRF